MARVLYIGGTGEISTACISTSLEKGDEVSVLNRGSSTTVPDTVEQFLGDVRQADCYASLTDQRFDVVCQFIGFSPSDIERDVAFFKDRCEQYIFISSASVYEKPPTDKVTRETTPLSNPYWKYAQLKIACENALRESCEKHNLPYTIVRPSHTYRTRLPGAVIHGDHQTWRMLNGKPVIVHGDGQSLWTLTHASDFAAAFVQLCANTHAYNQDFHITESDGHTWEKLLATAGDIIGVESTIVPIPIDTLLQHRPEWRGPLLGDKANSMVFDNTKLQRVVPGWTCRVSLADGLERAWQKTKARMAQYQPDPHEDALVDLIVSA